MDFLSLCDARRSVHHFLPGQKISDQAFETLLEAVRLTPSGYNAQPWEFVLVRDDERLVELQAIAFDQPHVTQAGNLVLVLGNTNFGTDECERILEEWKAHRDLPPEKLEGLRSSLTKERSEAQNREMVIRNVSLAAMTLMYAAAEQGWATCPMAGFSKPRLRQFLNLPKSIIPIMLIALGKADNSKEPSRLPRKAAKDIIRYEAY